MRRLPQGVLVEGPIFYLAAFGSAKGILGPVAALGDSFACFFYLCIRGARVIDHEDRVDEL